MADQEVLYHILEYLHTLSSSSTSSSSSTLSTTCTEITTLLEKEFSLSYTPETFRQYSTYPVPLNKIIEAGKNALNVKSFQQTVDEVSTNTKFEAFKDTVEQKGFFQGTTEGSLEYLQRYAKLVHKFQEKAASAGPDQVELQRQAEEAKLKGNTAIAAKDFKGALNFYSEAIRLSSDGPSSHVYYCNRAAAYCYLNNYEEAVQDCLSSIALSPDYVKAFSRLGLAYYHQEKFQEALDAYERAAELEPDNSATKDSIRQVKSKIKKASNKSAATTTGGAGGLDGLPGGAAGLSGLMGNPAMKKALDQVGGTSGLANLMKDPQMMAMAQQMMKDPAMMQQAMSMLGGGGGAGGGMPDMSALAGLMGGLGGGAGGDVPSSSSAGKGGKKPFKGFEE